MESKIHATAIVHPGAELGSDVTIGPYCVVGPKVKLGNKVKLASHVLVEGRTSIGEGTQIHSFASIGITPQDLKYKGQDTELEIGTYNSIREYVNISIGTAEGGGKTKIGSHNLIMVYAHIAHDCIIGDRCILANSAAIAGHVELGDHAVVGGIVGIHQFCKIGKLAMLGAGSMVAQDVPPYCMVHGNRATMNGLNLVGLRRANVGAENLSAIKEMYRLIFKSQLTQEDALAKISESIADSDYKQDFVAFLEASHRGLCR